MSGMMQAMLACSRANLGPLSSSITAANSGSNTGYISGSLGAYAGGPFPNGSTISVLLDTGGSNIFQIQIVGSNLRKDHFVRIIANGRTFFACDATFTPGATAAWQWSNLGVPVFTVGAMSFSVI